MYRYLLRSEKVNIFNSLADTAEILVDARFLFTSAILKLMHLEARSSPVLLASHVAQKPRSAFRRPFFSAPWFSGQSHTCYIYMHCKFSYKVLQIIQISCKPFALKHYLKIQNKSRLKKTFLNLVLYSWFFSHQPSDAPEMVESKELQRLITIYFLTCRMIGCKCYFYLPTILQKKRLIGQTQNMYSLKQCCVYSFVTSRRIEKGFNLLTKDQTTTLFPQLFLSWCVGSGNK